MVDELSTPPSEWSVKRIEFLGRQNVPIFCQSANGPCPLLAIANCLSLRNQISLPASTSTISFKELTSLVGEKILDSNTVENSKTDAEYRANLYQNIEDCLCMLSKLNDGLDVNPRFHNVEGFEATRELTVFDLLDICLVHGWIVDPQDTVTASVLGSRSYNELVEVLISTMDDASIQRIESNMSVSLRNPSSSTSTPCKIPPLANHLNEDSSATDSAFDSLTKGPLKDEKEVPGVASPIDTPQEPLLLQLEQVPLESQISTSSNPPKGKDPSKQHQAEVIRQFLEANCSQLTWCGLFGMTTRLKENQLAVFFRNNHFNVMFKFSDQLYLLVTDQGYLKEPNVIWERLDRVDGDTEMCGTNFKPYIASSATEPIAPYPGLSEEDAAAIAAAAVDGLDIDESQQIIDAAPAASAAAKRTEGGYSGALLVPESVLMPVAPQPHEDTDADLALAMQLQEQEEYELRKQELLRKQQQLQHLQQQQQQQQQHGQQQQQYGQQQQQQHQQMHYQAQNYPQQQQRQPQPMAPSRSQQQPGASYSTRGSNSTVRHQRPQPPPKPKEESTCMIS